MSISDERCIALTTYRKNGEGVTTPVWVNAVSDGRIGFWTAMGSGKTKRMTINPQVTVQASSYSGKPKSGSQPFIGTAEMVQSGPFFDEVKAAGKRKYGYLSNLAKLIGSIPMKRKGLVYGDTVVLIRLAD
jgi:PPOX class probable F420-dependent enzyme